MQLDFKKMRVDIIAVVIFAVVSLLYCFPQLKGKVLSQHDNISWRAGAREGMAYHDSTGKDVLWSNSMFGGMPTYTSWVGARVSNYTIYVQQILQGIGKPAYFFFIAMVCFYLLMRVLKVNSWLSAVGALAYAFSSYNAIIISVGHETKMLTMAYVPAAIAGLYLLYNKKLLLGAGLWGLSISLMTANNHFQVLYYFAFMFVFMGIAMLFIAIKEGSVKNYVIASAIAIAAAGIGISTSMSSILTTKEYASATMRGGASELKGHDEKKSSGGLDKDYAFRWSNGIGETFCVMIPYLYGGSSGESADKAPKTSEAINNSSEKLPLYWGPQPFLSGPVYFGAAICFLFVLGLLVIRSPHKWWVVAACGFGFMLSWGKNFEGINYFLFDHLPMLNKFRTPSMALVIPQFLFPMLGIWAVHEVVSRKEAAASYLKNIKIAAGITAGLCVLLGVGGSMFFSFTGVEDQGIQKELVAFLKEDRASLAMTSGLKSAFFILAAAALLWAFVTDKIKNTMLAGGLAIIVLLDLIPVAITYLNDGNYEEASDYENVFTPRDVDKAILQDKDPYYRVLDLTKDTYNDAVQAYFHKCVGGYSPAKMEIYQDLIDRHMGRENGFNSAVLNMLNTKYIIVGGQKAPAQVMPNPTACGNAWFVEEIKWAADAEEEINALKAARLGDTAMVAGAWEPKKTAVIRNNFKNSIGSYTFGKDSASLVRLDKYGLNEISFASDNSRDGLAVFSDIYYDKGWKAYIDGKETTIIRANYVLRALKVPAGKHKIEFMFKPESFYTGQKVATAGSILLLLLCGGALFSLFKKPNTVS